MIDSNARKPSRTAALPAALIASVLAACTLSPAQPAYQPPPYQQPAAGPIGSSGSTGSQGSQGSGGSGTSPLGPVYGAFVNGDFESGTLSGWSTTGNVAITGSAHAGSYAAQLGGPRTSHLNTLAQSFQLPANASWLSFWYRSDCDDATDDGETFATLARVDSSGQSLTLLAPSCTEGGAWLQAMAYVASYAGAPVTLRFSAGSNASASAATLLIDDVQIALAEMPVTSTCNSDAECGAGTVCFAGSCEPAISTGNSCTFDLECGTWQSCEGGACVVSPPDPSGCDSDIECGTGEVCSSGECVDASYSPAPGDACDTDADCGTMSCSDNVCTIGDSGSGSTGTAGSGDDGSGSTGSAGSGDDGSGDDGSGCGDSGSASSGDGSGDDGSGDGDDGSGDDGSGDDSGGDNGKHHGKKHHNKHNCRRPKTSKSIFLNPLKLKT